MRYLTYDDSVRPSVPAMDTTRSDTQSRMKDRLDHWKNRIQFLQILVENASMETKADLHLVLMELSKLEAAGKAHLEDVEEVAASAWDSMKSELTERWAQLCGTFEAIWGRIRTQRTN
jgi:hypothetical protein